MGINSEQLDALRRGEWVELKENGMNLVVLRADVFDRLRETTYDASPWTDEELDLLAAEDADALGWEGMEAYQDEKE